VEDETEEARRTSVSIKNPYPLLGSRRAALENLKMPGRAESPSLNNYLHMDPNVKNGSDSENSDDGSGVAQIHHRTLNDGP
jgi:hypothetical protein